MAGAGAEERPDCHSGSRAGAPRRLFAYVLQGNALMDGTIREREYCLIEKCYR